MTNSQLETSRDLRPDAVMMVAHAGVATTEPTHGGLFDAEGACAAVRVAEPGRDGDAFRQYPTPGNKAAKSGPRRRKSLRRRRQKMERRQWHWRHGLIGVIRKFGSVYINGQRIAYPDDAIIEIDGARVEARDKRLGQVARLARAVLALLSVSFILAGCAQALELERAWNAEEAARSSVAGYGEIRTDLDPRPDETTPDWRPATEQSEFEIVMTTACGAGDVFGCGLLLLWRALLALLHFLEKAVTLVLIALGLPWLIWTSVRETIERRRRKAKETVRDSFVSFIGPRLPTPGSDLFIGPMQESVSQQVRRPDNRPP